MIDFTAVSREILSLVGRRRELLTLLGSIFAGLGIFLQNVMQGNLPPSLLGLESHLIAFVAMVLMVASLLLSLRMARLHAGMVYNGILYAALTCEQPFVKRRLTVELAAAHNFAGASFLQVLLTVLIAGFCTFLVFVAMGGSLAWAVGAGLLVVVLWLTGYFQFHAKAVAGAKRRISEQAVGAVSVNEWEGHTASSLEQTNLDLLSCISFAGLMTFSVFETLSALGSVRMHELPDLPVEWITEQGPVVYAGLLIGVCVLQMIAYVRLQVAQGRFSLDLDPSDKPFRVLRLTDSFLGYLLLAFLLACGFHLLATAVLGLKGEDFAMLLVFDGLVMLGAALLQQLALAGAGRRVSRVPLTATAAKPSAPPSIEPVADRSPGSEG